MSSRENYVLRSIAALSRATSVDIVGERGSGRTHVLQEVREHFASLRWSVFEVSGIPSLRDRDMSALAFAGVSASAPAEAVSEVIGGLSREKAVIVVDDWEDVDAASRAVLTMVRERAEVPIIAARLASALVDHESSAHLSTMQVDLAPFTLAEFESALDSRGVALDPAALAAVWRKTGGNIGMAVMRVSDAERDGASTSPSGALVIDGPIWSDRLSASVETSLADVPIADRNALEFLARFGPVPLGAASRLLAPRTLERLERAGHIVPRFGEGEPLLAVARPPVAEHFLHTDVAASFLLFADAALDALGATGSGPASDVGGSNAALRSHVRLVIARDGWHREQTAQSGAAYAHALVIAGEWDEALTVVEASKHLPGAASDALASRLARVHSDVLHCLGRPMEAVRRLRTTAAMSAGVREPLLARSIALECMVRGAAHPGALAAFRSADCPEAVRAGAYVRLMSGDVDSVAGQLVDLLTHFPDDDAVHLLAAVVKIAQGDTAEALRIARRRMADARRRDERTRFHEFAYFAALAAVLGCHDDALRVLVREVAMVNGTCARSRLIRGALAAFALPVAGDEAEALRDASASAEEGLPGQSDAWWAAAQLYRAGERAQAADALTAQADREWESGARLAAACGYLFAAGIHPVAERCSRLDERVAQVGGGGIELLRRLVTGMCAGEDRDVVTAILDLEERGLLRSAERGWLALAELRRARGRGDEVAHAEGEAARIAATHTVADGVALDRMTARERQIMRMVVSGMTNAEIARELVLSVRTVESHVHRATRKAGEQLRDVLASAARRPVIDAGPATRRT